MSSPYRNLPAVEVLAQAALDRLDHALPHGLVADAARAALDAARQQIAQGAPTPAPADLAEATAARARQSAQPSLVPLINATGVIIQTNLGRAPLSEAALRAMQLVGAGYSNLEYDLAAGARGSRSQHLAALLCRLTGAEAALAVNNNAAAIYLALSALASGREVGTTNRTYARDYAEAIGERTALLMRIHTSNFQLTGFVHETPLADMAEIAHRHGLAVLDDLGSGTLLPTAPYGLAPEPTVQESVAAGAGLVTFSGDKLLGGPQAGLIVGRAALVNQLRSHPLARALRVDKTTLAGLEATLLAYLRGRALHELPVWRMIAATPAGLRARAERLAAAIGAGAAAVPCESAVGGGSLPGQTLPSFALALAGAPDTLARRLRLGAPPVIGHIADNRLLLDVRTVLEEQEPALVAAVRAAADS